MKERMEISDEDINISEKNIKGIIYILTVIMGIFYVFEYKITTIIVGIICLFFIFIGLLLSNIRKKANKLNISVSEYVNNVINK